MITPRMLLDKATDCVTACPGCRASGMLVSAIEAAAAFYDIDYHLPTSEWCIELSDAVDAITEVFQEEIGDPLSTGLRATLMQDQARALLQEAARRVM